MISADEQFAWDLVRAACNLPVPALPYAAHLLAVPPLSTSLLPETIAALHGLLFTRGSVERTPAVESFLAAVTSRSPVMTAMQTADWATLRVLQQDRHALAALAFLQSIGEASVKRTGAAPI